MSALPLHQEASRTSLHSGLHLHLLEQNAAGLWNIPVLSTKHAVQAIPMSTNLLLTLEKMTSKTNSKAKKEDRPKISTNPQVLQR
jgi:hypothetical protein